MKTIQPTDEIDRLREENKQLTEVINAKEGMIARLIRKSAKYEDRLFRMGAMKQAPCFRCGYNGPNYYSPTNHSCAARHHLALQEAE